MSYIIIIIIIIMHGMPVTQLIALLNRKMPMINMQPMDCEAQLASVTSKCARH